MLLFDSLRPSEIVRSIGASLFGVATVVFGVTHDNLWAAIIGTALGAGSVAWTFGIRLRTKNFVYIRKQNGELWAELSKLSEEMKVMREKQFDDSNATDRRVDQLVARGKLDSRERAHDDTLIEQQPVVSSQQRPKAADCRPAPFLVFPDNRVLFDQAQAGDGDVVLGLS